MVQLSSWQKKLLSNASATIAKNLPTVESANWLSDDILGKNNHQNAFQLSSDRKNEAEKPWCTLFSVEVDYEHSHSHDRVIPWCFQSRKAVPVSTDHLFSTTSSDGEDIPKPTVTSTHLEGKPCTANAIPTNTALLLPSKSVSYANSMFLDIVDISSNPSCGYSYIFRLVDPSHRGPATPLKSLLHFDIIYSVTVLFNCMKIKPLKTKQVRLWNHCAIMSIVQ